MTPEETYLEHLRTIKRIAAFVARRNHLEAADAEDFVQEVCLRLIEDDYAIIRKFECRSKFETYLTTVITRLFYQCRVEQWGKWRPSAEAKRLGEKAITLERLLSREGFTLSEAIRMLTTPKNSPYTVAELEAIHLRLPPRSPRPIIVSEDVVPDVTTVEPDAHERMEAADRARAKEEAVRKLDEVIEGMAAEDQLILKLRFWHGRRVPEIARALTLDQKKLYKRLERLFLELRREMKAAGCDDAVVSDVLWDGDE
jgi:RNA polymerase sigma factor for flagellar operon FliA